MLISIPITPLLSNLALSHQPSHAQTLPISLSPVHGPETAPPHIGLAPIETAQIEPNTNAWTSAAYDPGLPQRLDQASPPSLLLHGPGPTPPAHTHSRTGLWHEK
ncbi:hypothetical protein LIER_20103 [Lithospermum erythrorhizon]|uniref:Uncharacterized protein n=1 Tax=Lithospermum erythrorhizon TaxID=34254 RepID=A0AAV3QNW8_LITER